MIEKLVKLEAMKYFDINFTVNLKENKVTVAIKPKMKEETEMVFPAFNETGSPDEIEEKVLSSIQKYITAEVINASIEVSAYEEAVKKKK